MFDPRKLQLNATALFVVGIVMRYAIDSTNTTASAITMGVGLGLLALSYCVRDAKIPIKTRDLFDNNLDINEFKGLMKNDEAFAAAIEYVFQLSPNDLLKFARLIVEIRDHNDQGFLKEIAGHFRRKNP